MTSDYIDRHHPDYQNLTRAEKIANLAAQKAAQNGGAPPPAQDDYATSQKSSNGAQHDTAIDDLTVLRLKLRDQGYPPIPNTNPFSDEKNAGKRPPMTGWQTHCRAATPQTIASWRQRYSDSTNTAILCGHVIACDNDVLVPEVAKQLEELRLKVLGSTPLCRVGRAPKMLSVYRAEAVFAKAQSQLFYFGDGLQDKEVCGRVEILAEGQQFTAFGIHPGTKKPYEWLDGTPLTVSAAGLPAVTSEQVNLYIAEAEKLIRAEGGRTEAEINGRHETEGNAAAGVKSGEKPSYAKVASALDHFSPNDLRDREAWVRVGYAVHSALGEEGRELFLEWARGWTGYNQGIEGETLKQWKSFAKGRSSTGAAGPSIGPGTLFWNAKQNGWWWDEETSAAGEGEEPKRENTEPPKERVWPEPIELPNDLPKVDAFNLEFLPDKLAPWVEDISKRLQCPPDYVAVAALTSIGAVVGRRVGIKPQARTDWIEVPNFWGLFIGRPGMLKSPAMGEALKPIHHLEAEAAKANQGSQEQYDADVEEYTMRKQVRATLFKEALKKKASDATSDAPKIDDLGPEPKEPAPVRFRTNDSSYEAIGELLMANPNGILVERDELMALLRHLDSDQQAVARGFYLSGWSGLQPYTFDRITRSSPYRRGVHLCPRQHSAIQDYRICATGQCRWWRW